MSTEKTYELSFLALPHLSDDEVRELQSTCADAISAAGGQVASFGDVHFIPLAYEMVKKFGSKNKRYHEAYFTWMKLSLGTSQVQQVEEAVAKQADVLRYMIISTPGDEQLGNALTIEQDEDEAQEATAEAIDSGVVEGDDEDELPHEKLPETNVAADDLTRIEGIGPVIATTLENAGILTFDQLAHSSQEELEALLEGVRGSHDATTWSEQAALAAASKWEELDALQEQLIGGKEA
jgi:ribosomal protein S6